MTTGNNFYDLNATRGYPLDDIATGIDDDGHRIRDGILVDLCLRYPDSLGLYPYVSAIHVSDRLLSLVISAADDMDDDTLNPIASLVLSMPVAEGRACQLTGLASGVAGWAVFGSLATARYAGRFSTPAQSLLLPRVARGYRALPVPWAAKSQDEYKLVDIVRLFAGRDVAIERTQRIIADELRDCLVLRLTGALNTVLPKYTGPCGGRPESGTCSKPALEGINEVNPDDDGNIILNFDGMTVSAIPHGVLVGVDLSLPGLCPETIVDDQPDEDYCFSEISEISDSDSDGSESPSESPGESSDGGESSEIVSPHYPKCYRFYSSVAAPFITPPGFTSYIRFPFPTGLRSFLCDDGFSYPEELWEALFTGGGGSLRMSLVSDSPYDENVGIKISGSFQLASAGTHCGLVLDYRKIGSNSYYTTVSIEAETGQFVLRPFTGVTWGAASATVNGLPFAAGQWWLIEATIRINASNPTRVDILGALTLLGGSTKASFQVLGYAGYAINNGLFGFYSYRAPSYAGHLRLDDV